MYFYAPSTNVWQHLLVSEEWNQQEVRFRTYRFNEAIQVFHLECVWIHVIQMLKLFQKGLVVHCHTLREIESISFFMFLVFAAG